MIMKKFVILSSASWRKSIAITRNLGRKNYKVILCRRSFLDMACWSKYCYKSHKVSNKTYFQDLVNIGKFYKEKNGGVKPILIISEDKDLNIIYKRKEELSDYFNFLLPDNNALLCGLDKLHLYETLKKRKDYLKLLPLTFEFCRKNEEELFSESESNKIFGKNLWVLKPRSSSGSLGIKYLSKKNKTKLISSMNNHSNYLIQEFIKGEIKSTCVTIFMESSEKAAAFLCHERIYEYPLTGGPSTQRKTVFNKYLIKKSIEILKFLNWKGLASLEWKYCMTKKKYYLLEINPRPGGSISLDEKSNSNLILNYCRSFETFYDFKIPKEEFCYYKLEVKSTWSIPGDLLRYLSTNKNKRESIKQFLKAQIYSEEFALDDIIGFLGILVTQFFLFLDPKIWKYLNR